MIDQVGPGASLPTNNVDKIRSVSQSLEKAFLTEFLKHSGIGKAREGLGGGGYGEDQFSTFLVEAYAQEIARSGGIGLAETIVKSLQGGR